MPGKNKPENGIIKGEGIFNTLASSYYEVIRTELQILNFELGRRLFRPMNLWMLDY